MIKDSDDAKLQELGYERYDLDESWRKKWHKFVEYAGKKFELRIRQSTVSEELTYHQPLVAKLRDVTGSVFGTGFEVWFSHDVNELHEKMTKEIEEQNPIALQ